MFSIIISDKFNKNHIQTQNKLEKPLKTTETNTCHRKRQPSEERNQPPIHRKNHPIQNTCVPSENTHPPKNLPKLKAFGQLCLVECRRHAKTKPIKRASRSRVSPPRTNKMVRRQWARC